jgi:hypothetical protein
VVQGPLDRARLFDLLCRAQAWQPEPDPRTPMALARADGWVLKANLKRRSRARGQALAQAEDAARLAAELRLWHPAKTWFVLHRCGRWLAASATPYLRVGALAFPFAWFAWRKRRLVARARAAGYRLDMRNANFGRQGLSLYYLDDEIYPLR